MLCDCYQGLIIMPVTSFVSDHLHVCAFPQHSSAAELSVLLQIRVHVFKVHGVLFNEEGPMVV